jgi:hypothetical protein
VGGYHAEFPERVDGMLTHMAKVYPANYNRVGQKRDISTKTVVLNITNNCPRKGWKAQRRSHEDQVIPYACRPCQLGVISE